MPPRRTARPTEYRAQRAPSVRRRRLSARRQARERWRKRVIWWPRNSSRRPALHAVVQLHKAIFESLDGLQLQGHITMAPRDQWDALPNEDGYHTDDEVVDRLRVKK